ncbi:MAG TPA: OmpA family protein [Burkholderiaceae bacterium]
MRQLSALPLLLIAFAAQAQNAPEPVIAAGTVPDAATKAAVVGRLQELYGVGRVVDRIQVGAVAAPAGWDKQVRAMLTPGLKQVNRGQLQVQPGSAALRGQVSSAQIRDAVGAELASAAAGYALQTQLTVAASEQAAIDAVLGKRIVEFETGKAALTPAGRAILDDIAAVLRKLGGKPVEVVGHTDDKGARASNVALSQARAQAVKLYLSEQGVAAESIAVAGRGPDQPVADNATEAGRARNRRIEFRVL